MTFNNNKANTTGGALYIENDSLVTVTSSTFTDNEAVDLGSVAYIVSSTDVI